MKGGKMSIVLQNKRPQLSFITTSFYDFQLKSSVHVLSRPDLIVIYPAQFEKVVP